MDVDISSYGLLSELTPLTFSELSVAYLLDATRTYLRRGWTANVLTCGG